MMYVKHVKFQDIKHKYKYIIAWGDGPIFRTNYRSDYFQPDYIINGCGKNIGTTYQGLEIKDEDSLAGLSGKILIIIYTIYESQILKQINKYNKGNIDTIICDFLDIDLNHGILAEHIYSKNCEDLIVLNLIRNIGISSIRFLEIGVCHPVFRNNTYLLNEQFSDRSNYRGVLVEANPLCWDLIQKYRSNDMLLKCGVGNSKGKCTFYSFPDFGA